MIARDHCRSFHLTIFFILLPFKKKNQMENYHKEQKLGEGTYDDILGGVDTRTGEKVAIKIIRFDQEEDGIRSSSCREITILKSLNHPNIITTKEIICTEKNLFIILELMDKDLGQYLNIKKQLPANLIQSYAFQLLCGVTYLHANGIIHRDIRPSNLLIDRLGHLKIGDFGWSRFYSIPITPMTPSKIGYLWYRAPELLMGTDMYDLGVDIWSCACVIVEMIKKVPLFQGDSDIDQLMQIFSLFGSPTEEDWPEYTSMPRYHDGLPQRTAKDFNQEMGTSDPQLLDLLSKMLVLNPNKRISALECLHHPYFSTIPPTFYDLCYPSV